MNMTLNVSDLEISKELDTNAMVDLVGRGTSYGSWSNVGTPTYISGSYRRGSYAAG